MALEPAAVAAGSGGDQVPLDDLMLAMDVVDTLRRRHSLIEKELDEAGAAEDLKARLRKIYASQGIDVPDRIIEQGVAALREERFVYRPVEPSLATRLAGWYVSRDRWGPWALAGVAALLLAWGLYWFALVAPRAALPDALATAANAVAELARDDDARARADGLLGQGRAALAERDFDRAEQALASLHRLRTTLGQDYRVRVVVRPGENSGVWRIPDGSGQTRNYYLIVEAVDEGGRPLAVDVVNEETGNTERVDKWGLRVERSVFERIAADKRDDGIIQAREVGSKAVGYLQPSYRVATSGAAITDW